MRTARRLDSFCRLWLRFWKEMSPGGVAYGPMGQASATRLYSLCHLAGRMLSILLEVSNAVLNSKLELTYSGIATLRIACV